VESAGVKKKDPPKAILGAKKNITLLEAKRTAKNRFRWRSIVDALCSPLGVKMALCVMWLEVVFLVFPQF